MTKALSFDDIQSEANNLWTEGGGVMLALRGAKCALVYGRKEVVFLIRREDLLLPVEEFGKTILAPQIAELKKMIASD